MSRKSFLDSLLSGDTEAVKDRLAGTFAKAIVGAEKLAERVEAKIEELEDRVEEGLDRIAAKVDELKNEDAAPAEKPAPAAANKPRARKPGK